MMERYAAAAILSIAAIADGSPLTLARSSSGASGTRASKVGARSLIAEHHYRIIGKVRLLLFWTGNDNVGGARLTWRTDQEGRHTIAFLIGSDPRRAPRRINEWGYIREQTDGEIAHAFGIRSVADADSLDEAEARVAQGTGPAVFGVMCSTVSDTGDLAYTSSVRVPADVTYRDFGRLLDAVAASTQWHQHRAVRPPGASVGFLTALETVIGQSVESVQDDARPNGNAVSTAYMYKGGLFDLRLSHTKRLDQLRIGSEVFRDLVQGEFTIHNRASRDTTHFTATYGTAGALANVLVRATYQPHWWLKLELVLDERLDVPPDPDDNPATRERIREICLKVSASPSTNPTAAGSNFASGRR